MKQVKPMLSLLSAAILSTTLLTACGGEANEQAADTQQSTVAEQTTEQAVSETLPENLVWVSNMDQEVFANVNAPKGGSMTQRIESFPLTLRNQGPDSNGGFSSYTRSLHGYLVELHPHTREHIPYIATEWAYGDDNKTVYFKLNPAARWSDGESVTAEDFVYLTEFMTAGHQQAPFYEDYYTEQVPEVVAIDDYTIRVVAGSELSQFELMEQVNLRPVPKHFIEPRYDENWVEAHNWTILPTVAAYDIADVDMGNQIVFQRKEDWWAQDLKFMQGRYNIDRLVAKVIRDADVAREALNKGEIHSMAMVRPSDWHSFSRDNFNNLDAGYIQKTWGFTNKPNGASGVWLNKSVEKLQNRDFRIGIAHSLNFQKMIDVALRGDYVKLNGVGSGYGVYTNPDANPYPFDPDTAREYFAKAGYTTMGPNGYLIDESGNEASIDFLYLSPAHTERVSVLVEEARKAGLKLDLNLLAGAQGFKALLEKNHEAGFVAMGTAMLPDPHQYWHSDNAIAQTNNFTMTADSQVDEWIETFRNSFDQDIKAEARRNIEAWVLEDAAFIPGSSVPFDRWVHWRWIKNPENPTTPLTQLGNMLNLGGGTSYRSGYGRFWIDLDEKARVDAAMEAGETMEYVEIIDETYKPQ